MSEKPLHVQVAEALGWIGVVQVGNSELAGFLGETPGRVSRYDTDWSVTGPLIEKYGIELTRSRNGWTASGNPKAGGILHSPGATPLLAVCDLLITAASELGGLKAA